MKYTIDDFFDFFLKVQSGNSIRHVDETVLTSFYFIFYRRLQIRVQEPCESRGGRPGLSVLMSLTVSVDVKLH